MVSDAFLVRLKAITLLCDLALSTDMHYFIISKEKLVDGGKVRTWMRTETKMVMTAKKEKSQVLLKMKMSIYSATPLLSSLSSSSSSGKV